MRHRNVATLVQRTLLAGFLIVFGTAEVKAADPTTSTENAVTISDHIYQPDETNPGKPLLKKFVREFGNDQKAIWSSPFHMDRHDAKLWIGFTAITAGLIASDHWSSTQLENSKGQVRWGNHISDIGAGYTLVPIDAGFYLFGMFTDDPKARETGVLGGEALLDSLVVGEAFKLAVRRNRPDSPDKGEFFDAGTSFPSGHAIESWSLASLIAHEYGDHKFVPFVAYGLAGVVSAARFTAQRHYASDIVAGGAMGWFIGRYVYRSHHYENDHHSRWTPMVMPDVQPGTGTYAIALRFGQ